MLNIYIFIEAKQHKAFTVSQLLYISCSVIPFLKIDML